MSARDALAKLLEDLGAKREEVVFRRNGKIAYIRCIFHYEKTPSMRITPDLKYHCFGCGAEGDCREDIHKIYYPPERHLVPGAMDQVECPENDIPF